MSKKRKVWEKLKRNLNGLKGPRNVLILGDLGSGKSSFINTVITVLTGKYHTYVNVGNAIGHITICLQRYVNIDLIHTVSCFFVKYVRVKKYFSYHN